MKVSANYQSEEVFLKPGLVMLQLLAIIISNYSKALYDNEWNVRDTLKLFYSLQV